MPRCILRRRPQMRWSIWLTQPVISVEVLTSFHASPHNSDKQSFDQSYSSIIPFVHTFLSICIIIFTDMKSQPTKQTTKTSHFATAPLTSNVYPVIDSGDDDNNDVVDGR